jgi:hypothetical protein
MAQLQDRRVLAEKGSIVARRCSIPEKRSSEWLHDKLANHVTLNYLPEWGVSKGRVFNSTRTGKRFLASASHCVVKMLHIND